MGQKWPKKDHPDQMRFPISFASVRSCSIESRGFRQMPFPAIFNLGNIKSSSGIQYRVSMLGALAQRVIFGMESGSIRIHKSAFSG